MPTIGTMSQLFGRSDVRRRILEAFFARRGLESHVRETARLVGAGVSAVGRELDRLEGEGILESRTVGRNRVYRNSGSPVALAARDLFNKARWRSRTDIKLELSLPPGQDSVE